ncbi:MAG: 23S rRNA (guanosine(2251)-2'-O)-methyltransferase RlmB [Acidobacteria bacterium]|nr:23S rRNA (guanosine(2251)-2'-O)-methyltransferase RlmB [Acidobacteriota bacterium]
MLLIGINPVREALRAGRTLDRILIVKGAGGARLQELIDRARRQGISIRFEPRDVLDRTAGGQVHQGVIAFGVATQYKELDEVAGRARCLVVLDGVEDPHNLGAIIRTVEAAGADAVVIPERRAAGLSETVAKSAAGALEYVSVVKIGNVARTLEELKHRGFWIYGLDERGEQTYDQVDYTSPAVFVFGGEGKGLHDLVRKHCDVLVRIPMSGRISSLNVSVAAGVVLYEWRRRLGKSVR